MLTLAEQQIHHPAAANVLARLTAMVQDISIVATGVFEGIAEDRHALEGTLVVDGLGQSEDDGGAPGGIEGNCSLSITALDFDFVQFKQNAMRHPTIRFLSSYLVSFTAHFIDAIEAIHATASIQAMRVRMVVSMD
jgi:hypothetical protein